MKRHAFIIVMLGAVLSGCGSSAPSPPDLSGLPSDIQAVMAKSRYSNSTWSLLVEDVDSGERFYPLNEGRLSFTGSTRKLFSVGLALLKLGEDRRFTTTVHRQGLIDGSGVLNGDLILVAAGDLTFGGRRIDNDILQITDLDHNDANSLGTAILTPQDPLFALDQLAQSVKQAGIDTVTGEVAVDDRLFDSYRVPNGNLLITPIMVNENQIDVTITPTQPGQDALLEYRPETAFFQVISQVTTSAAGSEETIEFSGDRLTSGVGNTGTVTGALPVDYTAPLSGDGAYVGTFRVEDPSAFARTAFIEALQRHGVTVAAPPVSTNPTSVLPSSPAYPEATLVADYTSQPYSQAARLILKVSLNLGANLSLSLLGLEQGERTVQGALAVERGILTQELGIDGALFNFPTNGSGSPDSQAAPEALVELLVFMRQSVVGDEYQAALPILGVDGSLASTGTTLPGRGHVFAKTGTTIAPDDNGDLQLKAQCLAGYIESRGGRRLAYALMVNDAGPVQSIEADVTGVFEDQAVISSIIYESL